MNKSRCCHLRTKSLFTGVDPDNAFTPKEPEHATPSHFWCNLTQSVTGPDDRPVNPDACTNGRSCFEE